MKFFPTELPSVLIIEPSVFKDSRGYFFEMFQVEAYSNLGVQACFVQDNLSLSGKNAVRGLHYQLKHPQGKLVSVLKGKAWDVVVDIRKGSPHFGRWVGVELSEDNHRQVYVPPGFAHGFCSLSDGVLFHYKCTDYYYPEDEKGIHCADPNLKIEWPIQGEPILSSKDSQLPFLQNIANDHLPEYCP